MRDMDYGKQASGNIGNRLDTLVGPYPDKSDADREVGSVDREMSKLHEAIASLEHTIQKHVVRIMPVVLNTPGTGQGVGPQAPDVAVCDVAATIRELRRRLEMITSELANVTSRVDL